MIVRALSADAQLIYQEVDADAGQIPDEAILVHLDSGGTLCVEQRENCIVIDRETIPELVATLNKYRATKPRRKK